MSETKRFHIGDVLSVTTGRLVSLDHMDGIYNILNWMTGESLMTHQLPRAMDECGPTLRREFPDLFIDVPPLSGEADVLTWLASLEPTLGTHRDVPRADEGAHASIDPLLEMQHMVGADRVIPVVVD
jgi:hypothetical protein